MTNVTLVLSHAGKELHRLNTSVDDMHKLIGIMTYGGWKPETVKYIVDDYHVTSFEPLVVSVSLVTEEELNRRTVNQMAGLQEEFKTRLVPVFKRQTGGGETIN